MTNERLHLHKKAIHRISSKAQSQNADCRFERRQNLLSQTHRLSRQNHQPLIKPAVHDFQECGIDHEHRKHKKLVGPLRFVNTEQILSYADLRIFMHNDMS